MLEGETIERFGVVNGCKDCRGSSILKIGQYLLPDFHYEMGSTASTNAAELVGFGSHLLHGPFKYIRFENLADKKRAEYVT